MEGDEQVVSHIALHHEGCCFEASLTVWKSSQIPLVMSALGFTPCCGCEPGVLPSLDILHISRHHWSGIIPIVTTSPRMPCLWPDDVTRSPRMPCLQPDDVTTSPRIPCIPPDVEFSLHCVHVTTVGPVSPAPPWTTFLPITP